jgi:hypothetical protein
VSRVPSRCAPLLAVLVLLFLPAAAGALPGDPPVTPIAPADGATLPVDANGIPVTYSCPVYKSAEPGGFPLFGGPKDYGVSMSTSPALGSDGRLGQADALVPGSADPAVGPDGCSARLGAGGPPPRIQETPGTYYWQVWRLCVGCAGSYEVGPVRRLTLSSPVKPVLSLPRRAYADYGFFASIAAAGAPDGTALVVERQVGSSWKRAGAGTVLGGRAEAVLVLPRGKHQLRATLTIGSQTLTSDARGLTAAAARKWTTGKASDGSYRGRAGSRSVTFKIVRHGRELRGFKAFVPMTCPGVTAGQFTTQIGTAALKKAKIAPDGSFVAAASPERGTTLRIRGYVKRRKVTAGRVELSVGTCTGSAAFSASR